MVLFLALWLVGCAGGKVRHAEGPREGPVLILGDSLAAGYEVPAGSGFVEVLSQRLQLPIVNLSQKGVTTAGALPRLAADVLGQKPSLVILQLGGNDALQRVDPALTKANLAQMIQAVQAEGIPVMLLGVRGGLVSDNFAKMFSELASEYETAYVPDLLDGIITRPELKLDSVHPNTKGHQALADKVEPELRRVLKAIGKMEGS